MSAPKDGVTANAAFHARLNAPADPAETTSSHKHEPKHDAKHDTHVAKKK